MSAIHLTYSVFWGKLEKCWIAICHQSPQISWISETPEGAIQGIVSAISELQRKG